MKLRRKEPRDWNFDFSIYNEEKKEERLLNLTKLKRPKVTVRCSKFSPSMFELESLTSIKQQISERAIRVAAYTQEIKDLWELYGALNEYWAKIHDIFGDLAIDEIKKWKNLIERNLLTCEKRGYIPFKMHKRLLRFRDKIYIYSQRVNLGIQTQKIFGSRFKKGHSGIVE